jgi:hypothetical protein
MKSARTAACVTAALLALVFAACGGSSSNDSVVAAPASATSARGLTPPGTQLKLGQQATIAWIPPTGVTVESRLKGVKMRVVVTSIKQGSPDDVKDLNLDPGEQGATPYYVKVKFTAVDDVGEKAVTDDPSLTFDAFDDRGQQQDGITIIGGFEPCEPVKAPKAFTPGKSYETCLTYLLKGGGSIQRVQWADGPTTKDATMPYHDKPIAWRVS